MTWEELAQKIEYFPSKKIAKLWNGITTIAQWDNESLYEAWECFKDLLRKCPYHDIFIWLQIKTFYNRLDSTNHSMLDAIVDRALMNKTSKVGYELHEELVYNNYQWSCEIS